ncbi:MAG TPA: cysteine-rich CWC family protein [Polyangiaceae bacterium]|nr:cysteine-rich CWC family protein [Polyangiaceae bacterium]
MTSEATLDPSRCPLCGNLNSCAVVEGSTEPCWCSAITIPRETLEKIPLSAKDRACLCPRCAGLTQARSE